MKPEVPTGAAPLRVLHVVRPADGGIRQHVIELLRRGNRQILAPSVAGPGSFLRNLPPDLQHIARAALEIAPKLSPTQDLLAAARLAQIAKQADVIHAHGLRAGMIMAWAARLRPLPCLITVHNLVPRGRFTSPALQLMQRQSPLWIAVSGAVAEGLAAYGIPRESIRVIPNGIDLERFSATNRQRSEPLTVGCVARLSPEKGVDVLLRSAAQCQTVQFVIAGDGPARKALTRRSTPNVSFTGFVDDTRSIYSRSGVIVVPSRQEGQGIVALEAMASGIPVVASRVGGLADMLTDDETALLFEPENVDALTNRITRLLQDSALREKMSEQGRRLVEAHYDIRQMVASVEQATLELSRSNG